VVFVVSGPSRLRRDGVVDPKVCKVCEEVHVQYTAKRIQFDKLAIWRGNGTEPVYFDLSELRAALRRAGVR
jgi:hypothetical protein